MIPRDRGPDGAVPRLHAHWKTVDTRLSFVLNKIGTGPLDQCSVDSVRPGETVTRSVHNWPGHDVVNHIVYQTVYLTAHCGWLSANHTSVTPTDEVSTVRSQLRCVTWHHRQPWGTPHFVESVCRH